MKRMFPYRTRTKPLVDLFNERVSISIISSGADLGLTPTRYQFCYKNGILKVGLEKRKSNGTGKGEKKEGR